MTDAEISRQVDYIVSNGWSESQHGRQPRAGAGRSTQAAGSSSLGSWSRQHIAAAGGAAQHSAGLHAAAV